MKAMSFQSLEWNYKKLENINISLYLSPGNERFIFRKDITRFVVL